MPYYSPNLQLCPLFKNVPPQCFLCADCPHIGLYAFYPYQLWHIEQHSTNELVLCIPLFKIIQKANHFQTTILFLFLCPPSLGSPSHAACCAVFSITGVYGLQVSLGNAALFLLETVLFIVRFGSIFVSRKYKFKQTEKPVGSKNNSLHCYGFLRLMAHTFKGKVAKQNWIFKGKAKKV